MNSTDLLTAPLGRTIFKLSTPNIISMFVMTATTMAETWYVGQLGTVSLAALALVYPLFMLMGMLSAGSIGGAVAGAVAQALGSRDPELADSLTLHAFVIAILGGLVFSVIFLGFGRLIFMLLGGNAEVVAETLAYSDVMFTGCTLIWIANMMSSVVRAAGHMKFSAFGLISGSGLQIIVSGVLVMGIGPIPSIGIAGAAVGGLSGMTLASVLMLGYLLVGKAGVRLRFRGIRLQASHFGQLLKVGLLASLSPVASVGTIIVLTGFVARLGTDVLAGYGIGARLEFLMIPVIFGIGSALITIVGVHFGAGEIDRGHKAAWIGAAVAGAISGIIGIVLAFFPGLWVNIFSDSEAVRQACNTYLRIVGPFFGIFGFGLCLFFASQGARRMFWPVMIGMVRLIVISVGGALLVWLTVPTEELLFGLIALAMLLYGFGIAGAIKLGAWR